MIFWTEVTGFLVPMLLNQFNSFFLHYAAPITAQLLEILLYTC